MLLECKTSLWLQLFEDASDGEIPMTDPAFVMISRMLVIIQVPGELFSFSSDKPRHAAQGRSFFGEEQCYRMNVGS